MKKIVARIVMASVSIPALIVLIFFDWNKHLLLNLLAIFASAAGAFELNQMLSQKDVKIDNFLAIILGVFLPVFGMLQNYGIAQYNHIFLGTAILIFVLLTRQVFFGKKEDFAPVLLRSSGYLFLLFYPGLFLYFFIILVKFPYSVWKYFGFLLMVYGNDSWAYIVGMLFGKNSPKPFVASPNKSIVGFIGGALWTIGSSVALYYISPEQGWTNNVWVAILLAIVINFTAILGDLFESSLKRSAKTKDSGTIILGRGGMLDSIDSVLFSAPAFYAVLELIY